MLKYSLANASLSCLSLFEPHKEVQRKTSILDPQSIDALRFSNLSKDHSPVLSLEISQLLKRLEIPYVEAVALLLQRNSIHKVKLAEQVKRSYERLVAEANEHITRNEVTYEWAMNHFLKSIVLYDVTQVILKSPEEAIRSGSVFRNLKMLEGSKSVYFEDTGSAFLFATLSRDFSSLKNDAYFGRHRQDHLLIPISQKPTASEIVLAESQGIHFLYLESLSAAARRIEEIHKHIKFSKNYIKQSKWQKIHGAIVKQVADSPRLMKLYASLIADVSVKEQLVKRIQISKVDSNFQPLFRVLRIGHRAVALRLDPEVEAPHLSKASDYLESYVAAKRFHMEKEDVVALRELLRIVEKIEQVGVATP